jgi:signal peptidase II
MASHGPRFEAGGDGKMSAATTESQPKPPLVTRLGWTAYGLAGLVVVLDQASKAWVLGPLDLPDRGMVEVLPVFRLTMVWNPGVSFGLLAARGDLGRWLLVAFAASVVVALALWARRLTRPLTALAVGLVMGGAIGNNVIDRVRFGAVADFLDFSGLGFKWVFNVADSAISVGVALLLLEMLLGARTAEPDARA